MNMDKKDYVVSDHKQKKRSEPSLFVPGEKADLVHDSPLTTDQEIGGPSGLEPTRYGDWERNGRCSDF